MTVTPTAPITGVAIPAQSAKNLLMFRCSHPSIAGEKEHLYHARYPAGAALRFVQDCGTPGKQYQVLVVSENRMSVSYILCTPR